MMERELATYLSPVAFTHATANRANICQASWRAAKTERTTQQWIPWQRQGQTLVRLRQRYNGISCERRKSHKLNHEMEHRWCIQKIMSSVASVGVSSIVVCILVSWIIICCSLCPSQLDYHYSSLYLYQPDYHLCSLHLRQLDNYLCSLYF